MMTQCKNNSELKLEVLETSASGNKLTPISEFSIEGNLSKISINPEKKYQTITGFGGSFTEASAYLLNKLSKKNRNKVLQAYFGKEGANYSLTRTHISSCDFSLSNYTYAPVAEDMELEYFSIAEDKEDLVPMIKDAMSISDEGFKIIASPWTAPPWMKDNNHWVGGKLLPKYNDSYALFFSKYLKAYKKEGIDIWGVTVVNEPHGNGNNWESMHFSPKEMTDFVQYHLGPKLEKEGLEKVKIFGYDQNRDGLKEWVDEMYKDENSSKYYAGTAIHWYESTVDYFPKALKYAHEKAPNKYLIQTEACVDSEAPKWKDDAWYWSKEATDWGWDWAPEHQKSWHPKYVPVYRYARDIIGCLNNWVDGWVDWNMVLNKQGGPNWFKNWCVAPVIVDEEADEVYLTPIYYTLAHFSKYIRPKAVIIDSQTNDAQVMVTAALNPDKTISVILFNPTQEKKQFTIELNNKTKSISIGKQAIQTIIITN
ncbi:glycoside hydrolase family 30 protein [Tenacibaculum aiptasiae]|uniref:glycoside hydrolase family 30 protein n=1 Tax=Tenacibaculum aiptasiae TaxID=426481 RepID=UPI00232F4C76|nr:glycoside hydrolase family 30 protein [Tenacibaculum aiptasiae]